MSVAPYPSVVRPATVSVGGSGVTLAASVVVPPTPTPTPTDPDQVIVDLFALGEQGFWYDPSDESTVFQDVAGTIPVTALGQTVARINDKSGRGNHLTQATAASRPTWQLDANGKFYLAFDGVDDFMLTAAMTLTGLSQIAFALGVHKVSDAARGVFMELGAGAAAAGTFVCDYRTLSGTPNSYGLACTGSTTAFSRKIASPHVAPITNVVSGRVNVNTSGLEAVDDIRINGVAPGAPSTTSNAVGPATFGNLALYVGMRGGTSLPLNGRIYQMVGRFADTDLVTLGEVETWVNGKTAAY